MEKVQLKDEFIKLGQALKLAGLVENGAEAKFAVQNGQVQVNGETELQRGKKLYDKDVISFRGVSVQIESRPV